MSYDYHMNELRREMNDYERGAEMMERQMDKLIYENRDLRNRIQELELELLKVHEGGDVSQ